MRDATFRAAEITNKLLQEVIDEESNEYRRLDHYRQEIWAFTRVLFEGNHYLYDPNASGFLGDWTDEEILQEIEYLRSKIGISEIPWMSYANTTPSLINKINGIGGILVEEDPSIVEGVEGQVPEYDTNGKTLVPRNKPTLIGATVGDIAEYFSRETAYGYVLHAIYTAAEWASENPLLSAGEIGFVQENGFATNFKVGPGRWNDLSFFTDRYSHGDAITNPIGAVTASQQGRTLEEIIKDMISPYAAPEISAIQTDAGGSYANETIFELGQSLSGTVNLQYTIANEANLDGANPINVTAGGRFSNEGDFADGTIQLSVSGTIQPTLLTNIELLVRATHTNGITDAVKGFIRFQPKIIWGVSPLSALTASQLNAIADRQTKITDDYAGDYTFNQAGYLYIAIPTTLSPSNVQFADVTNELLSLPIDMVDLGVVSSVNNGVGTYNYQVFRTEYAMTVNSSKIRVK